MSTAVYLALMPAGATLILLSATPSFIVMSVAAASSWLQVALMMLTINLRRTETLEKKTSLEEISDKPRH